MARLFDALQKRSSTRRPRRVDGFKVGIALILLALGLMSVRTYFSYIDSKVAQQVGTVAAKKQTLKKLQKEEGNLGISHQTARPLSVEVPVYSFNPRLGRAGAPIQIIVFSNPTCEKCRDTVQRLTHLTRQHVSQMSLVVKTIPKPSGHNFKDVALNRAIEAGLFAALAADKNQYWGFMKKIDEQAELTADVYVGILAGLGIPLKDVRATLATNNERFLRQMEQDMKLMDDLGENRLPVVVVNNSLVEPLYGQEMADQAASAAMAFLR